MRNSGPYGLRVNVLVTKYFGLDQILSSKVNKIV